MGVGEFRVPTHHKVSSGPRDGKAPIGSNEPQGSISEGVEVGLPALGCGSGGRVNALYHLQPPGSARTRSCQLDGRQS